MNKKIITKFLSIMGTITLFPFLIVACGQNSTTTPLPNDTENPQDTNEKMPDRADVLPVAIFANSAQDNEINFSALIYHSDLAYTKTYRAVFVEANSADAEGKYKYIESLPFKFDPTQNSFSKDQENKIDRATEIKNYQEALKKKEAGDQTIELPNLSKFYKQQVNNIQIKNLKPNKEYVLTNIIYDDNGEEKAIWKFDINKSGCLYLDTIDSQFSTSTQKYTQKYDQATKEMVVTYFVNTKKVVEEASNWSYKLNLGIEKIEPSGEKITTFYISKDAYKATNFNILNENVAFEVRIKLNSPTQVFTIKSAKMASIFTYEKNVTNVSKEQFEDIYISPIK